uniref:Putative secreted protein n=1 Tax=Anopheles marajoara TaxID=58244 RepID=A0A2M4C9K0_9DIPT
MIEICESVRLFLTLFALTLTSKAARVDDSSSSRRSSSIVSPASSRSTSDTLVFISSISLRISRSSCSMLSSAAVSFRLRAGANRCSTLPYGIHGYYLFRGPF